MICLRCEGYERKVHLNPEDTNRQSETSHVCDEPAMRKIADQQFGRPTFEFSVEKICP